VLTIGAQNALPRTRLGIGTSAVRYLGQLGSVLGVAIVGTVVNNTLASDIASRLPASVARQLTPAGLKFATSPQVLVNPTYRDTVVHTAQHYAAQSAVAHVPPGPQHDQIVAAVAAQTMQQVQHLLDQVFATLKLSLALAIQHGLVAVLIFCGAIILATFFLKDGPQNITSTDVPSQAASDEGQNENAKSAETIA
jgi:hypothetical protein